VAVAKAVAVAVAKTVAKGVAEDAVADRAWSPELRYGGPTLGEP
jgi:hypothetical protein